MVTCPYAIRGTRFVRLRLGDDNNPLRNRMVANATDLSPVDYISRRTKTGAASTGSLSRRHHLSGDVTFPTFTPGQLMPHSFPRTQVVCPSPSVYPIELGRGKAFPGYMDSSSLMPRGPFDPGPRGSFRTRTGRPVQGVCEQPSRERAREAAAFSRASDSWAAI